MKKQQLAALCLAAGLALTGITSPVSAAQTGTGISMSADSTSDTQTSSSKKEGTATNSESNSANQSNTDSTDTTISPEQAVQTTPIRSENPTDTTNPTEPSAPTDPTDPSGPTDPTEPSNPGKPDTTAKNGVCYDEDTDTWNIYKDGELAEPCNGDGSETNAACNIAIESSICTGYKHPTNHAAYCTRKEHGPHHDPANVHSCIACSIEGVSNDSDFITVFRVVHVYVDKDYKDKDDYPTAVDTKDVWKPCVVGEHWTDLGPRSSFPRPTLKPTDNANGDIVHHKGEKRFVGVVLGLEKTWDESPECTAKCTCKHHENQNDET